MLGFCSQTEQYGRAVRHYGPHRSYQSDATACGFGTCRRVDEERGWECRYSVVRVRQIFLPVIHKDKNISSRAFAEVTCSVSCSFLVCTTLPFPRPLNIYLILMPPFNSRRINASLRLSKPTQKPTSRSDLPRCIRMRPRPLHLVLAWRTETKACG